MVMQLRRVDLVDLEEILTIERACFPNPWGREHLASEIDNGLARFWLCLDEEGGLAIGFMLAWFVASQVELHKIAVVPTQRRRGLGEAMLDYLVVEARGAGADAVHLEVRASNTAAIRLYEKKGFELGHRRRDYYSSPPEDALCFHLLLPPGRGGRP